MAALLVLVLAHPHSAPAAWCDTEIRDAEVALVLTVRKDVLGPWLGLDLEMGDPPRAALVGLFAQTNVVSIDGKPALPSIRSMEVPQDLDDPNRQEYLRIVLIYACATPPRRVTVLWRTFLGADWQQEPVVPGLVKHAPDIDTIAFSKDEPEHTWHRKDAPPPVTPVAVEPPPRPAPYLSLGLLAAAAAGAFLLRRRPRWIAAPLLAGGLGAVLAWPAAAGPVALPAAPEARALFETLHTNVYRAFDAETEDEIYDLLAQSVAGPLLQEVYLDVYESLVLRDQGGAVTRVEQIDVVDGRITFPDGPDADSFEVDWKWHVHCSVSHWGHTHRRINTYAADYTVRHDGRAWKIAGIAVREFERTDPDGGPR